MNPINNSFTSIEQVTGQYLKTQDNKTKEKTTGLSFEDVLRQQMGGTAESTSELKFSKHANMRACHGHCDSIFPDGNGGQSSGYPGDTDNLLSAV